MEDIIIGFIVSVVAGLFTIFISNRLSTSNKLDYKIEPKEKLRNVSEEDDDQEAEFIRQRNRKNLSIKIDNLIFFSISFVAIGASFYMPLFFSAGVLGHSVNFNETKLGIDFILNKDDFILLSAILAFIFYFPILFLSKKIAILISLVLTNFKKITSGVLIGLRIIIILFCTVFLGANVHWLLQIDLAWWDSIKMTFALLALMFLAGSNQ